MATSTLRANSYLLVLLVGVGVFLVSVVSGTFVNYGFYGQGSFAPAGKQFAALDPTHTECANGACVAVAGEGENQCQTDLDCRRSSCINFACVTENSPGPDYCSTNGQCLTCLHNGVQVSAWDSNKCGECSPANGQNNLDGCIGDKVGDSCDTLLNGKKEAGKCESTGTCDGSNGYAGACGLKCICVPKRPPSEIELEPTNP